ncbi:MAG TPA: M48 family metallopeptidase [Candidatus Eisenbacteria bacterium]|jgi:Zn-dependent protease with chaperone function
MNHGAAVRVAALAIVMGAALAVAARPAPAQPAPSPEAPASAPAEPAARVAPARDYLAEVRANFTPENRAYAARRVALAFLEPLWSLLVCLAILFSGLSARIRDLAHAAGRGRYLRVLVYFALFSVATFVLSFPLSWYQGFALEHQYGLSNQTFGAWLVDEFKALGLSLAFLGVLPVVAVSYWAIAKSPRRWWLWLTALSFPVTLAGVLLGPLVFEPAFNKFTPLKDKHLERRILDLAEKAGIPGRKVVEADKSAQTKKFNAYVSGFGASQRIVLWDTTLEGMTEDEILCVMGHEMGHYVLGHIWKGILLTVALSALLFYLSYVSTRGAVARFGGRWGFTELSDVASMPLIVATIGLASFVAQPLTNSFSRAIEHEADQFGLEITQLSDAAARAFLKLGSQNKSNPEPNPLVKAFLYTHPPLIERIRFALEYHPWTEGKPNAKFHGRS